jgi:hypothetical protein
MIHRFLIYDRKFNCRLDRRYPLNQFSSFNRNSSVKPDTKVPTINLEQEEPIIKINSCNSPWNTLIIKSDAEDSDYTEGEGATEDISSKGSLVSQLSRLELEEGKGEIVVVEHSQQLILGLTHSLKNLFLKLSPIPLNNNENDRISGVEGHSFSIKTSKYRLHYFESFTGWKLVMITDCNQPNGPITSPIYGQITPETALKIFYSQILLKFILTYPLGTVYTTEKSTQNLKIVVENDFLHRPGFLSKMDEFIQIVDRIF